MRKPLRFAVDRMLGRLCKWLRIMGFDAAYVSVDSRKQLEGFGEDGRIVLTRNQRWRNMEGVLFITDDHPMEQVKQVITALGIEEDNLSPLRICIRCNGSLQEVWRDQILGRVPEHIYRTMKTFHMCSKCQKVYWRGSHSQRMTRRLEQIFGEHMFNGNSKEGET